MIRFFPSRVLLVAFAALGLWANPALEPGPGSPRPTRLRFEVQAAPELLAGPAAGRLLVVLGATNSPEPRHRIGETGLRAAPLLGRDVTNFGPNSRAQLDQASALFPLRDLADLPAGEYWAQAVLRTNRDLLLTDAPGNLVGSPVRVRLDPSKGGTVKLKLDRRLPEESLPPDTDEVRYLKLRSEVLSQFYGRPMFVRAGIILPRGWSDEPSRRYPLLVRIGGFGTRYDWVGEAMKPGRRFRTNWLSADTPRFVLLQLDGAGPLGDPYQINSTNHGPYGDALVRELLPYVEAAYRCVGRPHARVLTGGSTGGWVALALQVFYPDVFGGSWSGYPDPPDFRALQLVNIYNDTNALVNAAGFERPCAREEDGDTEFTMRHETQLENVLGADDSFVFSGGQWGAWNATYSPRGVDGRPKAIWDGRSGRIDHEVADAWKRYDLRLHLEENWSQMGPKLRGKIRIWMGDADTYFLDTATRHLDDFLKSAEPPAEARIEFAPRKRHGWEPRSWAELLQEMHSAVNANAPKSAAANDDYLRTRFGHLANCPHCQGGR